jgi:hypothetical protein
VGFFVAYDYRLWVKLGTTASAIPTSRSTMTEIINIDNVGVTSNSDTVNAIDYASEAGFAKQLVSGNSWSMPFGMNMDITSAGYKLMERAFLESANGACLQIWRESPVTDGSSDDPEILAAVVQVSGLSEDIVAGNVAKVSGTLNGYGVYYKYQQGNSIATLTVTNGGLGLAAAASAVPLVCLTPKANQASGRGATATTTVNGSGVIQTVTIVAGGNNYVVGDTVTIDDASVFSSGDTAPVLTVATVS